MNADVLIDVTHDPIEVQTAFDFVADENCGGIDIFAGTVRNNNDGFEVTSLEYEGYAEMAIKVLDNIVAAACTQWPIKKAIVKHRLGHLQLKEVSVLIGVSAAHRDEAFKACRFIIEEIKHRLPVWKKEHYVGREPQWVRCSHGTTHNELAAAE